ncbi:MAG: hypothetical protein WDZ91_01555 [Paenibacillaceae bacterium]
MLPVFSIAKLTEGDSDTVWKFWHRKKQSPEQVQLGVLQQQFSALEKQSMNTIELLTWIVEKVTAGNEQTLKWSRSQYKSAQDIQTRLDKLNQTMDEVQQYNHEQEIIESRLTSLGS